MRGLRKYPCGGFHPIYRIKLDEVPCFYNHFTEMCSDSEAGSYLRLIDSCSTQLETQVSSRVCTESKEEEEEEEIPFDDSSTGQGLL